MNGQIQRPAKSVQLAVLATPTRTLADALAAARRVSRPNAGVAAAAYGVVRGTAA